jgi:hypothetical protein
MKKLHLFLLFCLSASLWAEIDFIDGVGLNMNFSATVENETDSDGNETTASEKELYLQPSIHFFIDEATEVVPFLTFGSQWTKDTDSISADIDDDYSRYYLGGGASLLWHFFQTWRIDLVTGLRGDVLFGFDATGDSSADVTEFSCDANLSVPLSMDFLITKKLTLRINADMVKMGLAFDKESSDDSDESTTVFESSFPFLDSDDMGLISLSAIYWLEK